MFSELPNSAQAFYNLILVRSIEALKLNTYLDNFDAARFNVDEIDRSMQFNAAEHAFHFDWFLRNVERLYAAYSMLRNDSSKRLYLYLIAFRLAGHFSVKLPVDFLDRKQETEEFRAIAAWTPSEMPGGLKHFDFEYRDQRYRVDCMDLERYLVRGQYFYRKDGVTVAPSAGNLVVDGGACAGETAAVFSNAVGPQGQVYCFDPVADHIAIVEHNAKQFPHSNVRMMPYGLSDKTVFADPIVLNQYAPRFRSGNQHVPLRSIDSLMNKKELPKMDFIKLDVEGSELESLRGARESIRRHKPKLAVALHHKPNDLFEILLYARENFPFYSCYIDHYTIHTEETVLYCTP